MGTELKSKYYDKYIPKSLSSYWINLYNKIIELLPINKDIKIADLGCGPGLFAEFLYKAGYKNYWGIDFSKECIKLAKKHIPSYQFIVGNLYDKYIQKEFNKHDIFISVETFEHITNDLSILKTIPKGKTIIFSVPNKNDIAHVRYFKSIEKVKQRYGLIFDFDTELVVRGVRKKRFFLLRGIKK